MNVKEGTSTSSPSEIPSARIHRCSALVPELTATTSEAPTYRDIACSNSSTLGPRLRFGVRRTVATASISWSVTSGDDRGILMRLVNSRARRLTPKHLHDVLSRALA